MFFIRGTDIKVLFEECEMKKKDRKCPACRNDLILVRSFCDMDEYWCSTCNRRVGVMRSCCSMDGKWVNDRVYKYPAWLVATNEWN